MKERPILFNAEMVRAILDGRKTQTRRVVKPQPEYIEPSGRWKWPLKPPHDNAGRCPFVYSASREWWEYAPIEAFAFQPGDRLWVRETWAPRIEDGKAYANQRYVKYRADGHRNDDGEDCPHDLMDWHEYEYRWRPSIHMPRWASRILLEVTNVRVERVQDISDDDAEAEGVTLTETERASANWSSKLVPHFRFLWDSIYAKHGWDANPWVWVVEFRRVEA